MNILGVIFDYLVGIGYYIVGVSRHVYRANRRLAISLAVIMAIMLGSFVVGLILDQKFLVIISFMISTAVLILLYFAGNTAIRITTWIAGKSVAVKEAKLFLRPIVVVSLAVTLMAIAAGTDSLDNFTITNFLVWGPFVTFLGIFFYVYLETKKKLAGWVMFFMAIYFIASNFIWPVHFQMASDYLYSSSMGRLIKLADDGKNGEIVIISKGTPLYVDSKGIKFKNTAPKEVKAKVIGRKKTPSGNETLLKVMLSEDGWEELFVAGKIRLVPARLTKFVQIASLSKSQKVYSTDLTMPIFKNYGFGLHAIVVEARGESLRIKIPPNARWEIAPIKQDQMKNWDLVPYGGEVVSFIKEKRKYVDYSDQDIIFSVVNKEEEGSITFRLEITPRT